jgi:hypothetical protein
MHAFTTISHPSLYTSVPRITTTNMVFYLWYRFFPCLERTKCLQEHTQQVKAWELSFSMCRETYNQGMIATIKLLVVTLLLLLAGLLHSKYWRLMLHLPTNTSNVIKAFSYRSWTANHQFRECFTRFHCVLDNTSSRGVYTNVGTVYRSMHGQQ